MRASRFRGRLLFEGRSHLFLIDASAGCTWLVEVLLFRAVSHHSLVLGQRLMAYLSLEVLRAQMRGSSTNPSIKGSDRGRAHPGTPKRKLSPRRQ